MLMLLKITFEWSNWNLQNVYCFIFWNCWFKLFIILQKRSGDCSFKKIHFNVMQITPVLCLKYCLSYKNTKKKQWKSFFCQAKSKKKNFHKKGIFIKLRYSTNEHLVSSSKKGKIYKPRYDIYQICRLMCFLLLKFCLIRPDDQLHGQNLEEMWIIPCLWGIHISNWSNLQEKKLVFFLLIFQIHIQPEKN